MAADNTPPARLVAGAADNTLPSALARAYQTNPVLNAERARQRGTDENVPIALSGYRPQLNVNLAPSLIAVRAIMYETGMLQTATLRGYTAQATINQILFNGFKTGNKVRQAEASVRSGREALRGVGQSVLLDAVTAYGNVLANPSMFASDSNGHVAQFVGNRAIRSRKFTQTLQALSTRLKRTPLDPDGSP